MANRHLLGQLSYTLKRLQELSSVPSTAEDKKVLRELLSFVIKTLQQLYPDNLSFPQRYQLLQNLHLLEQQFLAITPGPEVPTTRWQSVRHTLQVTLETTLAEEVNAPR